MHERTQFKAHFGGEIGVSGTAAARTAATTQRRMGLERGCPVLKLVEGLPVPLHYHCI